MKKVSDQQIHVTNSIINFSNELKNRRDKLSELRKQSIAFPNDFRPDHTSDQLYDTFNIKDNDELKLLDVEVSVAGRMITRRIMGKASFVTIQDTGGKIQLYISCDNLSEEIYNKQFKKWDLGDILGARGKLFKTEIGKLSIHCTELRLLTKALRPLPNKFHGLQNQEVCYRQRYLDLISNDRSRNVFILRSKILNGIRQFMAKRNFMEVETPMIQTIPGGACARPFITYHNALNMQMYLRIAPELYLKRLVIGGFDRVFEINRNFRNEGFSTFHSPEFTMMEVYMAYADYHDMIKLTESLFRSLVTNLLGSSKVSYGDKVLDFNEPFKRLTMHEAIKKYLPKINMIDLDDHDTIKTIAKNIDISIKNTWGLGSILTKIFEKVVVENLVQPTFITEYPVEVSPLARPNDIHPEITDRFEFFVCGQEIANGFSELNDAEEQAKRFQDQAIEKYRYNKDNNESMLYDEDYIIALEHGLPPTAGLGIGIDRLVMLLTNSHTIRDVILFPMIRPIVHHEE